MKKVVLGYSGGLDTSILIRFIKEKYGADVVAVTIGLGQQENLEAFRKKALAIGAAEAYVIDGREEFVDRGRLTVDRRLERLRQGFFLGLDQFALIHRQRAIVRRL